MFKQRSANTGIAEMVQTSYKAEKYKVNYTTTQVKTHLGGGYDMEAKRYL